jgi:hypothetical protein
MTKKPFFDHQKWDLSLMNHRVENKNSVKKRYLTADQKFFKEEILSINNEGVE